MNKAKRNYLGKLRKIVASHVYDLGKKIIDDAKENASEQHDVKLGVDKRLDDIVKEVIQVNVKVKNYIKATKDEVSEVLREGSKQAIAALKNEKSEGGGDHDDGFDSNDDEFFKSLGIDLDDYSDEELDDMASDDMDGDGEDFGTENDNGGQMATDVSVPENVTITKMSNDAISSAVYVLVASVPCEPVASAIRIHGDNIVRAIVSAKSPTSQIAPSSVDTGTTSKIETVKTMMSNIDDEMVPSISVEDIEDGGIVIEVIPTELPTKIVTKKDLSIKAALNRTIDLLFDKTTQEVVRDAESMAIIDTFFTKIDAAVAFIATTYGSSEEEIRSLILSALPGNINKFLSAAFYLGIVPKPYINAGMRLINLYTNKIMKEENNG